MIREWVRPVAIVFVLLCVGFLLWGKPSSDQMWECVVILVASLAFVAIWRNAHSS